MILFSALDHGCKSFFLDIKTFPCCRISLISMSKRSSCLLIGHLLVSCRVCCVVGHGLALMNSTGLIWKYSLWLLNRFLLYKEVTCYFDHLFYLRMTNTKGATKAAQK